METIKKYIPYIIILLLLIGGGILVNTLLNNRAKIKQLEYNNSYLNDTIKLERATNGELIAKTHTLQEENANNLLNIISKDASIVQLQEAIRRENSRNNQLQQAIVFKDQLIAEYRDSLNNIVVGSDTIGDSIFPVYKKEFSLYNPYNADDTTRWIYGNITLGKISFAIKLNIINSYDVTLAKVRKNILTKWDYITTVTSHNPYTNTQYVKSFSTHEIKQDRFGIGPSIGIGYPGYLQVSISLQYSLIRF